MATEIPREYFKRTGTRIGTGFLRLGDGCDRQKQNSVPRTLPETLYIKHRNTIMILLKDITQAFQTIISLQFCRAY